MSAPHRGTGWRTDLRAAAPAWLVARVLVLVGHLAARVLVGEGGRFQLDLGLLAWDAAWYHEIADGGYDAVGRPGLRFFPLVPALARLVGWPLPGDAGVGLVLVANVMALVAGAALHRLTWHETGDADAARRAAWLLALVPPAAVLVLGYSESTMIAAAVIGMLAVRTGRWGWAAAAGLVVGASRPVGLVLALPYLVEAARSWPTATWGARVRRVGAVASPLAGAATYLVWVHERYGSWRLPFDVQAARDLRGSLVTAPRVVWDAAGDAVAGDIWGPALHLPWVVTFVALLVVVARRLPASYAVYAGALLAVALTGTTLGSLERYGLSAFPLVMAAAVCLDRPVVHRAVLSLSGAGLVAFSAMVWLEVFVP